MTYSIKYTGRTIALVARAHRTKHYALSIPDDVHIWTLAACAQMDELKGKRIDRCFEMHPPVWLKDPRYIQHLDGWLSEAHPFPIYMQHEYPEYPSSRPYPLDYALQMLPIFRGKDFNKFLTSTLDYMLAMAIMEKPAEIQLIGFDMSTETEYRYQREGVSFWAGVAVGMGINVWIPPEAAFLYSRLYGYDYAQAVQISRLEELYREAVQREQDTDNKRHLWQRVAMADESKIEDYWLSEWDYHQAAGAANVIKQVIDDYVVGGSKEEILNRQRLEGLHNSMLIRRDEGLAQVNYWSGVLTDRQENNAEPEALEDASTKYNAVKARFYELDGASKILGQLVAEIDGQEAWQLDKLYNLNGVST